MGTLPTITGDSIVLSSSNSKPSIFAIFRNRDFTRLWIGDLVSQFGSAITSIAASILVYRATGSALSVGLMMMATSLPGLIFGLIAGVFVDRMDRRRIMIATEVSRAVLIALIPLLLPHGIGWMYVIVALSSTVAQFFNPAHESVLPDVATDEELASANALLSVSSYGAMGLGFAAAGFITSRLSVETAFFIDSGTFLLSALMILLVRLPFTPAVDKASVGLVFRNLKEGGRFLWNSPVLRASFLIMIPVFIAYGFQNTLVLPFATRALHATELDYGLIEGLGLAGFVVAGFVMASLADRLREGQWMAVSFIGMGIGTILFSQALSVPMAIALYVVINFMNVPAFIGRRLIIQRNTRRDVRGRVTSAFFVLRDLMYVIGMGLAGLGDVVDLRLLVLIGGVVLLVMGLVTLVMPGLGRPAAEWKRALALLRGATEAPGLAVGRPVTLMDLERYASSIPLLTALSLREQQQLITEMRYVDAPIGTAIVRYGEHSDAAYFILNGRAVAGRTENGQEKVLELLVAGDFFGEIAALEGVPRTANIVVNEAAALLRVPAVTLQQMSANPELSRIFDAKIHERMARMNMVEMPRAGGYEQSALRELRATEKRGRRTTQGFRRATGPKPRTDDDK